MSATALRCQVLHLERQREQLERVVAVAALALAGDEHDPVDIAAALIETASHVPDPARKPVGVDRLLEIMGLPEEVQW
jgi:hypothetical protein